MTHVMFTAISQVLITPIRDDACEANGHVSCFDKAHPLEMTTVMLTAMFRVLIMPIRNDACVACGHVSCYVKAYSHVS